jgi:uncharacterized protein YkwD
VTYFAWLLATAGLPYGPTPVTPPPAAPLPPAAVAPAPPTATVAAAYTTMRAVLDAVGGAATPAPASPAPAAPAAAPSGPPAPAVPSGDPAATLVALVNAARTSAGLPPYRVNPVLMQLAAERAQALARTGLFTHDIPGLGLPLAMEQAAGLSAWGMGAENLAEAGSVAQAFALLMASPEHRANILNPYETQIGVGVAPLPSGGVVVSQLFLGPDF